MREKHIIEYCYYVTPDGREYDLFGGQKTLMSWSGIGMATTNYLTDRGVFQDGETIRDFRIEPRRIDFEMYQSGCSRDDWWGYVGDMVAKIRPNRGSDRSRHGQLFIYPSTGNAMKIGAAYIDGVRGDWDGLGNQTVTDLREQVSFFCSDPVFSLVEPFVIQEEIVIDASCLPFCLPACVGSETINSVYDVDYQGTYEGNRWTITISGPIVFPQITNQTTADTIALDYQVSAGETVTINKTPTQVTVTNNFGQNLIGTVTDLSDLVSWVFATEGELTSDGVNTIQISGVNGVAGQTAITIEYDERHISAFKPR